MISLKTITLLASLIAMPLFELMALDIQDPGFVITGAPFAKMSDDGFEFLRFSPDFLKQSTTKLALNPKKAKTTSGVCLHFRLKGKGLQATFITRQNEENRGSGFGVFENGCLKTSFEFTKKNKTMDVTIEGKDDGEFHNYTLTLPSWSNPLLTNIQYLGESTLDPNYQHQQETFIAIGDSITHGVGQGSSTHLTYPFLLSHRLNMSLWNVAVGGGKISPPVANLLQFGPQAKHVSILIGYNDWNGTGKTAEDYRTDLVAFLNTALEHQPTAQFWIMRPLYTNTKKSKKSGLPIQPIRDAVDLAIEEVNDPRCHLVASDKFSDTSFLREDRPTDPVHLGLNGAVKLADHLFQIIHKNQ